MLRVCIVDYVLNVRNIVSRLEGKIPPLPKKIRPQLRWMPILWAMSQREKPRD